MIFAEHGTVRYRQLNALSWRVASELSRRDPGLYIGITYDGGSDAHADALVATSASGLRYSARRSGLGFTAGSADNIVFELPWDKAFGMPSANAIAVSLEESLGVHRPSKSPQTSPRALGYRVMASVLEMTLGDRRQWLTGAARGGPLDSESLVTRDRLQPWEDTSWVLARDNEPLATIDNFGWLEIGGRLVDLHSRYRGLDGRLYPLVTETFGHVLP
ncbi:hypothetical protein AB0N24_07155 [Arthrobacter sp. NPDC093128]|uniref:TY-Chap2 family putative peptide chaperone n=1 Tax=Arthrobacter sp. NPDC093128 TaxID=3154979 RepID=UPI003423EDD0